MLSGANYLFFYSANYFTLSRYCEVLWLDPVTRIT